MRKIEPAAGYLYVEHVLSEVVLQADPKNADGALMRVVRCGGPEVDDQGVERAIAYAPGDIVLLAPKSALQLPRGFLVHQGSVLCKVVEGEGEDEMRPRAQPLKVLTGKEARALVKASSQRLDG